MLLEPLFRPTRSVSFGHRMQHSPIVTIIIFIWSALAVTGPTFMHLGINTTSRYLFGNLLWKVFAVRHSESQCSFISSFCCGGKKSRKYIHVLLLIEFESDKRHCAASSKQNKPIIHRTSIDCGNVVCGVCVHLPRENILIHQMNNNHFSNILFCGSDGPSALGQT